MNIKLNKRLIFNLLNAIINEKSLTKDQADKIVLLHYYNIKNIDNLDKYELCGNYLNFCVLHLMSNLNKNNEYNCDEEGIWDLTNNISIRKYKKYFSENIEQKEKIENMRTEAINLKSDLDVIESININENSKKFTIINENSQNAVKTVNAIIETQTNSENMKKTPINNYDDDFSSYFGVVDESKLIVKKEEELDPIDEFEDKTDENGKFDFNKYIEQQKLLKQTQKQQDKQAVNNADDF